MSVIVDNAKEVIRQETAEVAALANTLTTSFEEAVRLMQTCPGKVVVTGMGKSGHIGKKIAATLASTGTPSFFVHPSEAFHGDLGMISVGDMVLALTNSGQTLEVVRLVPMLRRRGIKVVAMTGNPASELAEHADIHINVAVSREACPLNLAPTTSTTAMLVMGDALAVCIMKERHFQADDYAQFHPGGSLGRRLLTRVCDVMQTNRLPQVSREDLLSDIIIRISDARLGIAAVVEDGCLLGVITDGDVRRAMVRYREQFFDVRAAQVMSTHPKTIDAHQLIVAAEEMMCVNKIHSLIVVDQDRHVQGVVEFFNISAV